MHKLIYVALTTASLNLITTAYSGDRSNLYDYQPGLSDALAKDLHKKLQDPVTREVENKKQKKFAFANHKKQAADLLSTLEDSLGIIESRHDLSLSPQKRLRQKKVLSEDVSYRSGVTTVANSYSSDKENSIVKYAPSHIEYLKPKAAANPSDDDTASSSSDEDSNTSVMCMSVANDGNPNSEGVFALDN